MIDYAYQGTVQTPPIDYKGVPMAFWPTSTKRPDGSSSVPRDRVSAVCRSMADCDDLVHWFDNRPDFCPALPVLLLIPGNPTQISGLGFSTAAELRDCAVEVWGVKTSAAGAKRFNTDELRERYGYARKEDVPAMAQEAFWERRQRHLASPVTDPVKQFQYPNPTERTLHKVADDQEWKNA